MGGQEKRERRHVFRTFYPLRLDGKYTARIERRSRRARVNGSRNDLWVWRSSAKNRGVVTQLVGARRWSHTPLLGFELCVPLATAIDADWYVSVANAYGPCVYYEIIRRRRHTMYFREDSS